MVHWWTCVAEQVLWFGFQNGAGSAKELKESVLPFVIINSELLGLLNGKKTAMHLLIDDRVWKALRKYNTWRQRDKWALDMDKLRGLLCKMKIHPFFKNRNLKEMVYFWRWRHMPYFNSNSNVMLKTIKCPCWLSWWLYCLIVSVILTFLWNFIFFKSFEYLHCQIW